MNFFYLLAFLITLPFNKVNSNNAFDSNPIEKLHPFYVSVTEMFENKKAEILEISCKIFTDDFEKTLRMHYTNKIDLLNPPDKGVADKLIKDYINKHLTISIDGKMQTLVYVGYEKNEEGIECYFQINKPIIHSQVTIVNNVLFEYKPEQVNILHLTVNGKRQSKQLVNPNDRTTFNF